MDRFLRDGLNGLACRCQDGGPRPSLSVRCEPSVISSRNLRAFLVRADDPVGSTSSFRPDADHPGACLPPCRPIRLPHRQTSPYPYASHSRPLFCPTVSGSALSKGSRPCPGRKASWGDLNPFASGATEPCGRGSERYGSPVLRRRHIRDTPSR